MSDKIKSIPPRSLERIKNSTHPRLRGLASVELRTQPSNYQNNDEYDVVSIYAVASCGVATFIQSGFNISINVKQILLSFNVENGSVLPNSIPQIPFQIGEYEQSIQSTEDSQTKKGANLKASADSSLKIDKTFNFDAGVSATAGGSAAHEKYKEIKENIQSSNKYNIFKIYPQADYIAIGDHDFGDPLNPRGVLKGEYKPFDKEDMEIPLFKIRREVLSKNTIISMAVFTNREHFVIKVESKPKTFPKIFKKNTTSESVFEIIKGTESKTIEDYARRIRDRMIGDYIAENIQKNDHDLVCDFFEKLPDSIISSIREYKIQGTEDEI